MTRPIFLTFLAVLVSAVPCFSSSPAPDFRAPQFIALSGAAQAVAVADFNGDGRLDIAAATQFCCPTQITLSILMGKGHRNFEPPVSYSLSSSPMSLTVGDFNNDGYPDIAVGETNGLEIFLNRGDGTFLPPVSYQFYYVSSVAVGDFNGDHNLDLALAANNSNFVIVMLGKGDGTFPSSVNYAAGNGADAVTVADFNGDGKLDLAVCNGYYYPNQFQNQFNLLLGNGDGSFQSPVAFATDDSPVAIAAADFNGDGKIDVAVLNSDPVIPLPGNTDVVDVFINNGNGTFQPKISYHADFGAASLVATDLNGDGISDIAVCNAFDGDITVLLSGGNGTFRTPRSLQSYVAASFVGTNCMAAGDFTGSGRVDLVTSAQNGVAVLHNISQGRFNVASDYGTGAAAVDMAVGDFTGDGNLDIVTAHIGSGGFPSHITVIPGKGDGSFFRSHHINTDIRYAAVARHLAVGDFNNDGILDVAVLLATTNGELDALTVLLGNGDGTFRQGHIYSLPSGCWEGPIAVGDLNGDGFLDLVVAYSGCGAVTVFLGKGNGDFTDMGSSGSGGGTGNSQQGIAIGDFNNDGKPDIAVTNGGGSQSIIGILLGRGDGTFRPVRTIADGSGNPYAVVAADFNGDGNLDLAITNYDTSQVMILPGRGNGTFGSPKYLSLSQPSRVLLSGDFNGDGKLDLVTIPEYEYVPLGVSVSHGNGDGTFQRAQNYPTGVNDVAVASGNFQGTSSGLDLAVLLGWTYDPLGMGVTVYLHPPPK
jgi:hypothetical protein